MKTISRLGRHGTAWLAGAALLAGCGGGSPAVPTDNVAPAATITLAADSAVPSLGAEVRLSGAGASGAGNLVYAWSLRAKPADSAASLPAAGAANTAFTPDRLGTYVVRLRVTGAGGAFAEQDLSVTVTNHLPVALIDKSKVTLVSGTTLTATGGLSYDEDGDALSYSWSVDSKPADSAAVIDKPASAALSFLPDRIGNYTLLLTVSDGKHPVSSRLDVKVLALKSGAVALPFTPLDARYSKSQDRVVLAAAGPDALKIVDPFSGIIKTVLLPAPYKAMALSADGKLAAVLHEGALTLVDLATATVLRSAATAGAQTEVFLTDSGVAYLVGQTGGQWVNPAVGVLEARSGVLLPPSASGMSTGGQFYGEMKGVYSQLNNKAFAMSFDLSPSDITYFTVSPTSKEVLKLGDSPYHGDYNIGAPLALSSKEDLVFTSAGTYFRTDTLVYAGKLALAGTLASLSQSEALETLAFAASKSDYPDYAPQYSAAYQRYTGELLLPAGELPLPTIEGLQSYGRYIFHSGAGNHVAVVQTGSAKQKASGLKFYLFYR